jgi:hypothetical protein
MKVTIERSGGVVARKVRVERDEATLTQDQLAAVKGLFEKPIARAPATRSESFSYKTVVEDERGAREIRLNENDMPKVLSSLLPD